MHFKMCIIPGPPVCQRLKKKKKFGVWAKVIKELLKPLL